MKRFTLYIMSIAIVAFAFSSCLKDDDNNTVANRVLTQSEKVKSLIESQGAYTGKLYYYNNSSQSDSIDIHWTVSGSDSILTITDFPISAFSNSAYTDATTTDLLKNSPTKELSFTLHGYYNSGFDGGFYSFTLAPNITGVIITPDDEESGKDNTINISYANYLQDYTIYGQTIYTYPICEYFEKKMQGYVLIDKLMVNSNTVNVNKAYYFYGKKD
ncbi:MAG: DUF4840 domain-containing protein [Prevotella sp.]|nr:DUF4840 domain-containing protein [Prevotella sp.]MBR5062449.1 DUF4840 domain-containing protein [Prevotella sp.]